ncbi:DUF4190 domain-containing protein [Galactobacter valiniphilus]|uniref:DUF4190 domain-containing protein n=1 Tax=Galactobacter valiniphilus TaxID=2676122 RepID=UPI003734FFA5
MSIPSRDSFENTPESADWAQQPEGDRSWAVQDPANDPANPYGRSALFGDAAADPYAAPAADPYAAPAPPAADAFPVAPPAAPYAAQADPFAAPAFPTAPGAAPLQSNPYAQPYPQQVPYGQQIPQQPYPPQFAPYGAPIYQAPPARGLSITGMVLGIASMGLFLWAFLVPPVVGLIFSILGLIKEPRGKGMAITGLILSGLGLILWFLVVIGSGGWFWSDYSSYSDTSNV